MKRLLCASALMLTALLSYGSEKILSCKSLTPSNSQFPIWPTPYISSNESLCFNVKGWPEYSGSNCVKSGGTATWTGLVLVSEDQESQGRDSTKFRVMNPVINSEQISYSIEWSRGAGWRTMQKVSINRLTGMATSYSVLSHGGETYQCQAAKRAF